MVSYHPSAWKEHQAHLYAVRIVESCTPATCAMSFALAGMPQSAVAKRMQAEATVMGLRPARTPSSPTRVTTKTDARCTGTGRPRWLQYRVMNESADAVAFGPAPGPVVSNARSRTLKHWPMSWSHS